MPDHAHPLYLAIFKIRTQIKYVKPDFDSIFVSGIIRIWRGTLRPPLADARVLSVSLTQTLRGLLETYDSVSGSSRGDNASARRIKPGRHSFIGYH
jgi:hypothetical protein